MDYFEIGLLEPREFSANAIKELQMIGNISVYDENNNLELFLESKDIIFVRLKRFIGTEILNMTPRLKYICTPTTGLNHIDIEEAEARNIQIVSLKGETEFLQTIRATPEHIFGMVLSLLRNYKQCFLSLDNSDWDREKYRGCEIFNNSIGIIGLGRVGMLLAQYYYAFGAKVYFYDINPEVSSKYAVKVNSIEELIDETNIVLLCASYSPEYNRFFSRSYIDALKDKYFVNASRGENIDESYLIQKIEENWFKGIALDVIADETLDMNHKDKLLDLVKGRNLILTPHIAGATYQSMWKTEEFIVSKLQGMLER